MSKIKSHHDLNFDALTDVPIVIDYAHHETHDGNHYEAHIRTPVLGDGDTAEMFIRTPDTSVRCHFIASFSAELVAHADILESATVSLSGSVVPFFNNDRNYSNGSDVAVRSSPTLITSGTRIDALDFGGGKKGESGGLGGSRNEWILKQGTVYILRMLSEAADNHGVIKAAWYEHEG